MARVDFASGNNQWQTETVGMSTDRMNLTSLPVHKARIGVLKLRKAGSCSVFCSTSAGAPDEPRAGSNRGAKPWNEVAAMREQKIPEDLGSGRKRMVEVANEKPLPDQPAGQEPSARPACRPQAQRCKCGPK